MNAVDCRRQTALLHAVLSGRAAVVAMLTAAGADAGVRNIFGNSALDIALSQRRKVRREGHFKNVPTAASVERSSFTPMKICALVAYIFFCR